MVTRIRGMAWEHEVPGSEVTRMGYQLLWCCQEIKDEEREMIFDHREVEGILLG